MKYLVIKQQQKGVVLITSLILLLVLTLAISTSLNTVLIEEKVVANQRDRLIAMEAADSALREAEKWITDLKSEPVDSLDGSISGVWSTDAPQVADPSKEWWLERDANWWESEVAQAKFSGVSNSPRYVIETFDYVQDSLVAGQQKDERGRNFFRITARGTGGTDTARVLLQTTFTKRF